MTFHRKSMLTARANSTVNAAVVQASLPFQTKQGAGTVVLRIKPLGKTDVTYQHNRNPDADSSRTAMDRDRRVRFERPKAVNHRSCQSSDFDLRKSRGWTSQVCRSLDKPLTRACLCLQSPTCPEWYNAAVSPAISTADWDVFLEGNPQTHLLQTSPWGELKAAFGWDVAHLTHSQAGAQVLFYRMPLGLKLAYIPKGPIGSWFTDLLPELDAFCRDYGAFALKIEPDLIWDEGFARMLQNEGFQASPHEVQPRRTLVLDIDSDEDTIIGRMHQKTRYNIRLASRKGVTVRPWDDPLAFGRMLRKTAARAEFGAHIPGYFERAYKLFHPQGACEIFLAEFESQPLAALQVFARGERAWYFYGASTTYHRSRMPTYLLQWEAIRWAKSLGCRQYDLWGVPDAPLDQLEEQFTERSDGLWGVYRFKRGFGGDLVRSMGAWDRPYNRAIYALYRLLIRLRRN
jgi:peptidoglycan pentaglycine glycine transferase (the first glycine)